MSNAVVIEPVNLLERLGAGGSTVSGGSKILAALRERGRGTFTKLGGGLPHKKMEEWRQTDISPLAKQTFVSGSSQVTAAARALRDQYTLGDEAAGEIVMLNGVYSPALSQVEGLNAVGSGVQVLTLGQGDEAANPLIARHLGAYAKPESGGFVALNAAGLRDGVVVLLHAKALLKKPIHVLSLVVAEAGPVVSHSRVLVVAEAGAQGSLVETFAGQGAALAACTGEMKIGYFTNAITEIVLGAEARLEYCRLQQEEVGSHEAAGRGGGYHVATIQAQLEKGATLISDAATLGAALSRTELNVRLNGPYAEATLNGLVLIGGNQHADNHTLLDHAAEHCPSHELYKHVLNDRASGVFKGKILVRPGAQKTDAKQTSKTLLLSNEAVIDSQPALEIYADDVKCTHGTTTGPVDDEMIFYLRSRGISVDAARHLLTYAFAADITRRIKVQPVRQRLETIMAQQHDLPLDLRISADGK